MNALRLPMCLLCLLWLVACIDEHTRLAGAALEVNIPTTDYTALIEVTAIEATENGLDAEGEYIQVRYSANVLQTYSGDRQAQIQFIDYVEADEPLAGKTGNTMIISLCRLADGTLYVPEIGYKVPATRWLQRRASRIAAQDNDAPPSADRICDDFHGQHRPVRKPPLHG